MMFVTVGLFGLNKLIVSLPILYSGTLFGVSLCNSFGNAAVSARATDSDLHGYLITWEGTRIIARVTSWYRYHYSDVIMSAMVYHITSLTIVYSTIYSGADKRKHQSSASLPFVGGISRWPVDSPHKGPVTQKMFPFDDVIMAACLIGFRYLFHKWFSITNRWSDV